MAGKKNANDIFTVVILVSSDLENLDNLEMSGNVDARREVQGIVRKFCCVKFIFSQSDYPNFLNFLWEHASILP